MSPLPTNRKSFHQKQKSSKGLVRIIGGKHRTRRLPVLVHEGLRPTSDRLKETLFNWLMTYTPKAHCLDMFAGSGSLGIEALSRGAAHVCFIEQDAKAATQIRDNIKVLKETENATVLQGNALSASLVEFAPFDLVFIDPPFGLSLIPKSIEHLHDKHLLKEQARIYIEASHDDQYQVPKHFQLLKEIKTSQVLARLYAI